MRNDLTESSMEKLKREVPAQTKPKKKEMVFICCGSKLTQSIRLFFAIKWTRKTRLTCFWQPYTEQQNKKIYKKNAKRNKMYDAKRKRS